MRLADRLRPSTRTPSTRVQRIGFAFFWLIVTAYGFFIASDANWNTESHLYTAFALVDHHTVSIDDYRVRLGDRAYWNGHYYSDKAPGLALAAAPVYAGLRLAFPREVGQAYRPYPHMRYAISRSTVYVRYIITYVLVIVPSAILAILLWLFLSRFTSYGGGLMIAGVYALGTPAYAFSIRFYSHQFSAVLLFSAFLLIFHRVKGRLPSRSVILASCLAGLLCAYAAISEYPTAVISALIAVYAASVSRDRLRCVVTFCIGSAPPILLAAAYNAAAFGRPFATGYTYVHSALYHSHVATGVLGMSNPLAYGMHVPSPSALWEITFGLYRGIFPISPVLLVCIAGLAHMWRCRALRPEFYLIAVSVVAYFLLDASRDVTMNGWSGGASVASRHLVPVLPFMVVPAVFGLRSRLYRFLFIASGCVSVGITWSIVSSVGLFSMTDRSPITNELLPAFFGGHFQPSWGFMTGSTSFAGLLPLLAVVLILVGRITWLLRRPDHVARVDSPLMEGSAA